MSNVLVVAVHPDDETLGCGGTLLRHKENGDDIYWLICTETDKNTEFFKNREKEIVSVENEYDFAAVFNLGLKATEIDKYPIGEIIGKLISIFDKVKPNTIYLPFNNDVHSDHRKIFEACYSCTKSFRYKYIKKIYMFETLSETEFAPSLPSLNFTPNTFVDISKFFEKKCSIMKIYTSEVAEHPFPRSIENLKALATFRGACSGFKYAESFVLLKEIW